MSNKPTQSYAFGVRVEWSDDNRLATISTDGDMSREAIDLWAEVTLDIIQQWPQGEMTYLLFNMTGPKQGYTPYAARRTRDLYKSVPNHAEGYVAVVMRDTLILRMMSFLMHYELTMMRGKAKQQFFISVDDAYRWLHEKMVMEFER